MNTHPRIGLDIGGTKIAGCLLGPGGTVVDMKVVPTPLESYGAFLDALTALVQAFDARAGIACTVGAGIPGRYHPSTGHVRCVNIPYLQDGKPLAADLGARLDRPVLIANDANCAALAEATDGAGAGFDSVAVVTLGTGVGSGFVLGGHLVEGRNGLAGEIGHLPLPWREEADGPLYVCACGATGCIEQSVNGAALSRLYTTMTGSFADVPDILHRVKQGEEGAKAVMDRYITVLAKALTAVIYSFDPHVIVLSGGLSNLPDMCGEVPRRWGRYTYAEPATRLLLARHGPMAGVRGAALLGR